MTVAEYVDIKRDQSCLIRALPVNSAEDIKAAAESYCINEEGPVDKRWIIQARTTLRDGCAVSRGNALDAFTKRLTGF